MPTAFNAHSLHFSSTFALKIATLAPLNCFLKLHNSSKNLKPQWKSTCGKKSLYMYNERRRQCSAVSRAPSKYSLEFIDRYHTTLRQNCFSQMICRLSLGHVLQLNAKAWFTLAPKILWKKSPNESFDYRITLNGLIEMFFCLEWQLKRFSFSIVYLKKWPKYRACVSHEWPYEIYEGGATFFLRRQNNLIASSALQNVTFCSFLAVF